jgi:hypothetical protein
MPAISEAEKQRRRRVNTSVMGTNAMEGIHPDTETLVLLRQFEEGHLTREQLSEALDRHVENLVAASRPVAAAA